MSTLEELRENVKLVIDDGYDDDVIDNYINAGIRYVASKVLLPGLESAGQVTTELGVSEVAIPDSWAFSRNLYAASTDAGPIQVASSTALLLSLFPGMDNELQTGSVQGAAINLINLQYFPVPQEETVITCRFYKKPDNLTNDSDTPDCIPTRMHEELLENFAIWKLFKQLEDGIDGRKINTTDYKKDFYTALDDLDDTINSGQSRATPLRQTNWE